MTLSFMIKPISASTKAGERTISNQRNSLGLSIVEYDPSLAEAFYTINAQWISSMFVLEPVDEETLSNPQEKILDPGGAILFVKSEQHGIVGACALKKTSEGVFELTKMGVLETARGLKAGEFLLAAILKRAKEMEIETLYLLTSSKCEAAIHLYEKLGFHHSAEIMQAYGASYERCDVAMHYRG
jgi:ribosomal protein S18 acetylase RimI-like enzyme